MSQNHTEWTDLLSAYLDGELDPVSSRRLEQHLGQCADCRAVLEDLRRIVAAAPLYRGTPPADAVWTGIRTAIEGRPVVSLDRARQARRYPLRQLIAAGLVMAVAGAGATWVLLGGRPDAAPDVVVAVDAPAPDAIPASTAADRYDAAVAELEAMLAANRERLDTATIRVLETSLVTIDRAIAEARAAIQRDSGNAYLNGQIAANLRKKVNLLRLATRALASET